MASTPAVNRRQFLTFTGPPPRFPLGRGALDGHWIHVYRRAMACRFDVTLAAEDAGWISAARTALNLADRLEARLTVFRESSELSRVNRQAAEAPVTVHPGVFALLRRCAELHAATGGAFDVTSTPLSRCWGFLQREPKVPSQELIDSARACTGMHRVVLDEDARTVAFARNGVELNLGSIGKGYALDRMGAKLRCLRVTNALLSAGGSSILAIGADTVDTLATGPLDTLGTGSGWPVQVSSRLHAGVRIARVRLADAAMATSGGGEQFLLADGRLYGHVLDPRTGWPAAGVLSATAITSDAATADALSTAFLIGGPELAAQYCDAWPGVLAILALDDDAGTVRSFGSCAGAVIEELNGCS